MTNVLFVAHPDLGMMWLTPTQSIDLSEMMVPYYDEDVQQFEPAFLNRKRSLRQMRMGKRSSHGFIVPQLRRDQPF